MGRQEILADEHRKAKEGSGGKYNYVDTRALEKLGIMSYKAEPGDNFVRIISPKFSKYPPNDLPSFWKEVWTHSHIGADDRTFVCLKKMKNLPCPICELAERLKTSDGDKEKVKALWSYRDYLFFVYDVKNAETEKKGLHWYDAPVTFKVEVISISRDKRTGKFIDVSTREEGMDIEFERIGKGMNNTEYRGFCLRDNGVPPKSWYDSVPDDFEEFILYPSYETVAEALGPVFEDRGNRTTHETVEDPASSRSEAGTRQEHRDPVPPEVQRVEVQRDVDPPTAPPASNTRAPEASVSVAETRTTRERGEPSQPETRATAREGRENVDPEVLARIKVLRNRGNTNA